MIRLIPSARWDAERVLGVKITPLQESTKFVDDIETQKDSHDFQEQDREGPNIAPPKRRVNITFKDLQTHGVPSHCPQCSLHEQGVHRRARMHAHTEACRARAYDELRKAGSDKMMHADAERTQASPKGLPLRSALKTSSSHGPAPSVERTAPAPQTPTPPSPSIHDVPAEQVFGHGNGDDEDTSFVHEVVNEDSEMLENAQARNSSASMLACDRDELSDIDDD